MNIGMKFQEVSHGPTLLGENNDRLMGVYGLIVLQKIIWFCLLQQFI